MQNPKTRVAIFTTGAFSKKQFLNAVSGHVQIPLMAAKMLSSAGYDVTLITTKAHDADYLPFELSDQIDVLVVPHATRSWPQRRVYVGKAIRQILQLRRLLGRGHYDVVHFFGGTGTGQLLCLLRFLGIKSVAFYTPIKRPPVYQSELLVKLATYAFKRVNCVLATASYIASGWATMVGAGRVRTLYPGITKSLKPVPGEVKRNSVLFWRNAGYNNGADVAMRSFSDLALSGKYPNIRFVFAVRPNDEYEAQLLSLARRIDNIDVHIYPYREGVTLATFLSEALFVVQPFRKLTVNPQFAILESLYAGVPVIATDIESNSEVVRHGENGLLIASDDVTQLSEAIDRLLSDGDLLAKLTENAYSLTERQWNWHRFGEKLLQVYDEN